MKKIKAYKCTDCKEISYLEDNGEIRVGFCKKCGHPLWNPANDEDNESQKHDESSPILCKAMTDKLAEEILAKFIEKLDYTYRYKTINERNNIINELHYLMETYHNAKMKEITDADIEHKADDIANCESSKGFERGEWLGFKEGARAFRDGKIKHNG